MTFYTSLFRFLSQKFHTDIEIVNPICKYKSLHFNNDQLMVNLTSKDFLFLFLPLILPFLLSVLGKDKSAGICQFYHFPMLQFSFTSSEFRFGHLSLDNFVTGTSVPLHLQQQRLLFFYIL